MAKAVGMQKAAVLKWFGEQGFEAQDKLLSELGSVFERGKAGKIQALEAELARLKGGAAVKKVAAKPATSNSRSKTSSKVSALAGRKVPPKYRHPKNKSLTWAGRGVHPKWIAEYLKGGGKLESLLIRK